MLYLFCSLNAPNAFLIPCRSQWRTTFSPNVQERFFPARGYPCASFVAWGADKCSEVWQCSEGHCLSRNVPQDCISAFRGTMFSIWCSTCIMRTWQKDVRHWLLQGIRKAARTSMLNTKMNIEWHQLVENWTLFQVQYSLLTTHENSLFYGGTFINSATHLVWTKTYLPT